MNGQQVAAVDTGHDPGGPADERLAFGAAGESDDDPFACRPGGSDPCWPILGQSFIHAVGEPNRRSRAARRGCRAGISWRGRRRLLRRIDVSGDSRCRRSSGAMSTSSIWSARRTMSSGTVSRRRLPVMDAIHVAQRGEVLDIDGGEHINAGGQQSLDVLPPLGIPAPRRVGVGVLVHDGNFRVPGQDSLHVQFLCQDAVRAGLSGAMTSRPAISSRVSFLPWSAATPTTTSRPLAAS